jgi:CRP-like cAMP-binding protein
MEVSVTKIQSVHGGMRYRVNPAAMWIGVPDMRAPRRNHLLAALPNVYYQHLLPALEPFPLCKGSIVRAAGAEQQHLYFITAGVISRWCMTEDGKTTEFATTGNEGVVGVSLCLGGGSASSEALVLCEGFAYRLRSDRLMAELGQHGLLLDLLLRYTRSMMAHTGWIAICNRHHPVQQQLCRWLLNVLDRAGASELAVTHEVIAGMLGVRRESVSLGVKQLHDAGVIRCERGHITVLDRHGLEARACRCYFGIRREYGALRPDEETHASFPVTAVAATATAGRRT